MYQITSELRTRAHLDVMRCASEPISEADATRAIENLDATIGILEALRSAIAEARERVACRCPK